MVSSGKAEKQPRYPGVTEVSFRAQATFASAGAEGDGALIRGIRNSR